MAPLPSAGTGLRRGPRTPARLGRRLRLPPRPRQSHTSDRVARGRSSAVGRRGHDRGPWQPTSADSSSKTSRAGAPSRTRSWRKPPSRIITLESTRVRFASTARLAGVERASWRAGHAIEVCVAGRCMDEARKPGPVHRRARPLMDRYSDTRLPAGPIRSRRTASLRRAIPSQRQSRG